MNRRTYTTKPLPRKIRYCKTAWDSAREKSDPILQHLNAMCREDETAADKDTRVELESRQAGKEHSLSVDAQAADFEGVCDWGDPLATAIAHDAIADALADGRKPADADESELVKRVDGQATVDSNVRDGWHGNFNENIAEKTRKKARAASDGGQIDLVPTLPPPDLGDLSKTPQGRHAAHVARRSALHNLLSNPWNAAVFFGHESPKYLGFWIRAHRTRRGSWYLVDPVTCVLHAGAVDAAGRLLVLGAIPDHSPAPAKPRHWAAQQGHAVRAEVPVATDRRLPAGVESKSHWIVRWAAGGRGRYVPDDEPQAPAQAPAYEEEAVTA